MLGELSDESFIVNLVKCEHLHVRGIGCVVADHVSLLACETAELSENREDDARVLHEGFKRDAT